MYKRQDEAIELNPNFAEAYKERGRAKLLNGDKDGSVEDMKKSLELKDVYKRQDYGYSSGGYYYHSSYDDTWELHGVGVRFGFEF